MFLEINHYDVLSMKEITSKQYDKVDGKIIKIVGKLSNDYFEAKETNAFIFIKIKKINYVEIERMIGKIISKAIKEFIRNKNLNTLHDTKI